MKKLAILGSTGSIGRQTLDVVRQNPEAFKVVALTAAQNVQLLKAQVEEFKPEVIALLDEEKATVIRDCFNGGGPEVLDGEEGISACAASSNCDIVVNGLVGISGLIPTLKAIEHGKDIALANKETLVAGGHLVVQKAIEKGIRILPVDSEHSAIFQCIAHACHSDIATIILTASGGPFRGKKTEELEKVTIEDALKHPNWSMGKKITIDSATLMNKGLEVIEARWLFNIEPERIKVVIHPQSIIHSMVEFVDGSVLAQMGCPDMRLPIQYALSYPKRINSRYTTFNPSDAGRLDFYSADTDTFTCLKLAYYALEEGGTMPVVLNGSNEMAVRMFLQNRLSFTGISRIVECVMEKHETEKHPGLDEIIYWDAWSRKQVISIINGEGGAF